MRIDSLFKAGACTLWFLTFWLIYTDGCHDVKATSWDTAFVEKIDTTLSNKIENLHVI